LIFHCCFEVRRRIETETDPVSRQLVLTPKSSYARPQMRKARLPMIVGFLFACALVQACATKGSSEAAATHDVASDSKASPAASDDAPVVPAETPINGANQVPVQAESPPQTKTDAPPAAAASPAEVIGDVAAAPREGKKVACTSNQDCRLEANYCGGCHCMALRTDESGLRCKDPVACLRNPCDGSKAVCKLGKCEVESAAQ
jgi:hypothetical protein